MSGGTGRYSIGQLARLTGLSVKTIRFYADGGLVPPCGRTEAGYRTFDNSALVRLALVRTLRDLDFDLATIRRVLEREARIEDVAAAHAQAIDAQIRTLRLRRSVLRAIAQRGAGVMEVARMNQLALLSAGERRRIITDFLDDTFAGLSINPEFEQRMRSAMPELPDEPSTEQINAWIELGELVSDPDFRRRIRQMAQQQSAARQAGEDQSPAAAQALAAAVIEHAGAALTAGIAPDSAAARPVIERIIAAAAAGQPDTPASRRTLADRLATGTDARAERYWQLLAGINGWPVWPSQVPAFEWAIAALRASGETGNG